MKKLLFAPLTILFITAAFGQNRIDLNTGIDYFIAKDKTASTLVYSGIVPVVESSVTLSNKTMIHRFRFQFGAGTIENRKKNSWKLISAGIYHYSGYKIQQSNVIKVVGLATGAETVAYSPRFRLSNIAAQGNDSGYVSAFLGAFTTTEINLTRQWQLEATGVLPLVEYAIRSGYSTSTPDELIGTDVPTFGDFVRAGDWKLSILQPQFSIDLGLERKNEGPITYKLKYGFGFTSYDEPLEFSSVKQQFTIGVIWQW